MLDLKVMLIFIVAAVFQDLQNHEDKVSEVNTLADQLVADGHPDEDTIRQRQNVSKSTLSFSAILHSRLFIFMLFSGK